MSVCLWVRIGSFGLFSVGVELFGFDSFHFELEGSLIVFSVSLPWPPFVRAKLVLVYVELEWL